MKSLKKFLVVVLTITLTFVNVNTFSGTTVRAATVYKTDVTTPSTGNVFISIVGTYYSEASSKIIKRINEIRYEACKEGVINPETGKKLTMKDYKPVKWANSLEKYARLRAAEASVNWSHTRPNNKSTFKNSIATIKNGYHSAENLAMGYNILDSIEGYYSEKVTYVKKKTGITGHYTNIISPKNTLIGAAAFVPTKKSTFSAIEFGALFTENAKNNSTQESLKGSATQLVEVNANYLINSISLSGNNTIFAGSTIRLTATANMKNATKTANIIKGLTWKSSNTKVATVDANGNVKGVKAGTATITVACGGKTASYKITVKKNVRVSSVKLNVTSKTIKVKEKFKLTPTVSPTNASNKSVVWKSSNMNIATVDSKGNVTGLRKGTTFITVTTKDGSKKAICKVIVK